MNKRFQSGFTIAEFFLAVAVAFLALVIYSNEKNSWEQEDAEAQSITSIQEEFPGSKDIFSSCKHKAFNDANDRNCRIVFSLNGKKYNILRICDGSANLCHKKEDAGP